MIGVIQRSEGSRDDSFYPLKERMRPIIYGRNVSLPACRVLTDRNVDERDPIGDSFIDV